VDLFLETSRAGLESIRKAAGEVRKPELAKALHKLKGGCGTIGATGMYAVVRDLEAGLKDFPAAEFDAGLGRLEAEFARTRETLKSRS
jgi:HPt (histidine-containing phosphotransfer) domain-containing protein